MAKLHKAPRIPRSVGRNGRKGKAKKYVTNHSRRK